MSDDNDLTMLSVYDGDDDWPKPPAPEPPGHVDVTARLSNGSVWRVATVSEDIVLTLAGADGMTSIRFGPNDSGLLVDALNAAELDAGKIRRGAQW